MAEKLAKDPDVLNKVRAAVSAGHYTFVGHAEKRLQDRHVTTEEVVQVLLQGRHEKAKDEWKPEHNSWNYAFRGKTLDTRELRIAVTLEEDDDGLLIITVIDLDKAN